MCGIAYEKLEFLELKSFLVGILHPKNDYIDRTKRICEECE